MGTNEADQKTKNDDHRFLPVFMKTVTQKIDNGSARDGMQQVDGKTAITEIPSNFNIKVSEKVNYSQGQKANQEVIWTNFQIGNCASTAKENPKLYWFYFF